MVKTLEVISEGGTTGWNTESCRLAESLMTSITKFQFLIAYVVTKQCFQYTKGLTISLQKRAKDICQAYDEVDSIIAALSEVRSTIDVKHKEWFDAAVALGQTVDAPPPQLPRCCSRQTAQNNTPGETPDIYYKRTISIPFLDELISHLNSRFSEIQKKAIMGMRIVSSVFMDDSQLPASNIQEVLEYYHEDLPSPSCLDTELHLWRSKWRSFSQPLPDTPAATLGFGNENIFPNIHCLLRLVCTIPVTSCECERSVSILRRLKTYLRSTMGQDRLSGLALMHMQWSSTWTKSLTF